MTLYESHPVYSERLAVVLFVIKSKLLLMPFFSALAVVVDCYMLYDSYMS